MATTKSPSAGDAPSWPPIIARHPGLVASLAEARERQYALYPVEVLCGFLARVEQRFPGMQISCLRPYYTARGREWSVVNILWESDSLLRAGLIAPEELPQGAKRIWRSDAEADIPLTVTRRRAGWIEARFSMQPEAAGCHPLSFFSAASVRGQSARPLLRLVWSAPAQEPRR